MTDVIQDKFSVEGYRNIALAYKDIKMEEFLALKAQHDDFKTEADRHTLEQNLTLAAVLAL